MAYRTPLKGNVRTITQVIRYNDAQPAKLFDLPRGALPIKFMVDVVTAFDDTGTDLLDIGTLANADAFVNDADLSSEAVVHVDSLSARKLTSKTTVYGTYTGQNGNAAAGETLVTCVYSDPYNL